uniref:Uncharacterized protein n=1 Tax=Romanomermis culicivorax TaxID=13658 RepID=A0A915I395_ROMCU
MYQKVFISLIIIKFFYVSVAYDCQICQEIGKSCTGPTQSGCEYCAKMIGMVRDPSKVTPFVQAFISKSLLKNGQISDLVNKTVVSKLCTNEKLLALAGEKAEVGCKSINRFGLVGRSCLCKGDCVYPLQICPNSDDIRCVEAIEQRTNESRRNVEDFVVRPSSPRTTEYEASSPGLRNTRRTS